MTTLAPAAMPAADAHNDLLMLVEHFRDDPGYFRRNWLPQLQAGQVRTQVLPVYVDEEFLPEMALLNVREDIVVRPLGNQVTHRQIMACMLDGAYRSPATAAMLEVITESVAEYTATRTELVAA